MNALTHPEPVPGVERSHHTAPVDRCCIAVGGFGGGGPERLLRARYASNRADANFSYVFDLLGVEFM